MLPHGQLIASDMTIGTCISYCAKAQDDITIRYAGVEAGNECWCGAEGAQYDQYGERNVSECSTPCSGNAYQTCGGDYRIAVYECKCLL